jgi:hypothetical protein
MADNVQIPATGSGDATPTVATYEDGSDGHIQRVVLAGPDEWSANENHTTAQTNNALKTAGGASTNLGVVTMVFSTDTAMTIKLVEDTGGTPTDLIGPYYFPATSGEVFHFDPPIFTASANVDVGFTTSAAGNYTITLSGIVV